MSKLTKAQKDKYVAAGGGHCPFCESDEYTGDSITVEGGSCSQEVSCDRCGERWYDCYTLTGVELNEPAGAIDPQVAEPFQPPPLFGYRYVDDSETPIVKCPNCTNDLTDRDGAVLVDLSVAGREISAVPTRLDEKGQLVDTADRAIQSGFHSLTYCGRCSHTLTDFECALEVTP